MIQICRSNHMQLPVLLSLGRIWGQTYRLLLVTIIMSFLDSKSQVGFCRGIRLCRISPNGTEMFSVGISNIHIAHLWLLERDWA